VTKLSFSKSQATGAYRAVGESHIFYVRKESTDWTLEITKRVDVAGVPTTGKQVTMGSHDTRKLCIGIANVFEGLGDGYTQASNGHRSRATEAVIKGYEEDAK
jgi:hypothetical protein